MNPQPSFTFLRPIPPSSSSSTPDLTTTLSTLKNLINLSHSTLHSLSSSFLSPPNQNSNVLISCPFNPNHHIPPKSLFLHSLHCPNPVNLDLKSLHYPHTLLLSQPHQQQYQCNNANEDLCFSLADYYPDFDFGGVGFFYRDCPGVVSACDRDDLGKWTFTLPGFLLVECANVVSSNREMSVSGLGVKYLVSDYWRMISCEVDMWTDYPTFYSGDVFCVVADMGRRKLGCDFKRWVIVNSPFYGVVIDEAMRDHVFSLFRISFKAIVREAFDFAVSEQGSKINLKSMRFNCPILVQVLEWLASQLSILYGEVNGKMFGINMFKQCLIALASRSLLIPIKQKDTDALKIDGAQNENGMGKTIDHDLSENTENNDIYVYQVAAAVAALHERASLEEKIKALRRVQPFTKYQLVYEHEYLTKRAEVERLKRANYRPIVEHDGFLMQPSYNQESNKTKTREELLAEERDYKRRRMSYHGKKLKRTRTQVTRDIINDYMKEIKRAGGIGCFVKGAEEGRRLSSEPYSLHEVIPDKKRNIPDLSAAASPELLHDYTKQSFSVDNVKSFSQDYDRKKQHSQGYKGRADENFSRTTSRDKRGRKYDERSPDGVRNEQRDHRREQKDLNVITPKHDKDRRASSIVSKYSDATSSKLETKDTRRRNTYRSQTSNYATKSISDDRYDPSESQQD